MVADYNKEDRIVSSVELREELKNLPKQQGFSSGYPELDAFIKDFKEGDLVIITGLTGQGKSQFAVSLCRNLLKQKINSVFFSFEISNQELLERFGVDLPVFYLPRMVSSRAASWIEKKIIEAKEVHGVKAVFVDHLHYLTDDESVRNKNLPEILGHLCRQFKLLARKHRVILFLLAHTRKIRSDANRPTVDDLKDSSGIAQEADTVLIVHRKGKQRKKKNEEEIVELSTDVNIWIDKNRRTGMLGCVEMWFDHKDMMHKTFETDMRQGGDVDDDFLKM